MFDRDNLSPASRFTGMEVEVKTNYRLSLVFFYYFYDLSFLNRPQSLEQTINRYSFLFLKTESLIDKQIYF